MDIQRPWSWISNATDVPGARSETIDEQPHPAVLGETEPEQPVADTGQVLLKLRDVALPTVMRKIVEHGIDEGGPLFAVQTSSARKR